jgi:hypothetical protein
MDDEDIAALVIDNGSGMCKGKSMLPQEQQYYCTFQRVHETKHTFD